MFDPIKSIKSIDRDELLEVLGLQPKRELGDYLVPGLLLFGAGVAVGCGLGLMLAPRSGAQLREKLGEALDEGLQRGREHAQQVRERLGGQPEPEVEYGA